MRKNLSILLALALTLGLLTGCAAKSADGEPAPTALEATEQPAPSASALPEGDTAQDPDAAYAAFEEAIQKGRAAFDPETVIATVDGMPLTWKMFYYFVAGDLQELFYYLGGLPEDFSEKITEDDTWQAYLSDSALKQAIYYMEANAQAEALGVVLTEEQRAEVDGAWDRIVADYPDEAELQENLDAACLDKELFLFLVESNEKLTALMDSLYGAAGEKLTDGEVLAWAAENGYVRTKHVLWSFLNEKGELLDEEAKTALKTRLEGVVAELRALGGDTKALEARFDEIMNAESADPGGLASFPAGYTYTKGTMTPAFEDAAFALGEYGLSDPVETEYGYHILLGLPLDPDGLTMDQDASTGGNLTLRQSAANKLFVARLAGWIDNAKIEWTDGYENLEFNKLFHGEA